MLGLKKKWHDFMHNEELKHKIYMVIYDTDSPMGKMFDVLLIVFILVSVLVVILESLAIFPPTFKFFLSVLEWVFTVFFTIEYLLRLYSYLFGLCLPERTWLADHPYPALDPSLPHL